MKILDKFKEILDLENLDEDTAKSIIHQLDNEIEEIKAEQQEKDKELEREESLAWAEKVIQARVKNNKKNQARLKLRFESTISPARRVRLRKLGKIK